MVQLDYSIYGLTSHCERLVSRKGRLISRHIVLCNRISVGIRSPVARIVGSIICYRSTKSTFGDFLEYRQRVNIAGTPHLAPHETAIGAAGSLRGAILDLIKGKSVIRVAQLDSLRHPTIVCHATDTARSLEYVRTKIAVICKVKHCTGCSVNLVIITPLEYRDELGADPELSIKFCMQSLDDIRIRIGNIVVVVCVFIVKANTVELIGIYNRDSRLIPSL